jgi:hypothetical protein
VAEIVHAYWQQYSVAVPTTTPALQFRPGYSVAGVSVLVQENPYETAAPAT